MISVDTIGSKKPKKWTIRNCRISGCPNKFAELHHILPKRIDPKSPLVPLCANHHTYANQVQEWLESSADRAQLYVYAESYFDQPFLDYMSVLISGYDRLMEERIDRQTI